MKLRTVKPGEINVPETRVTSFWDSELLEIFKASIKAMGILEPPVCVESDGKLFLVDGLHRFEEVLHSGAATLQVVVLPGKEEDVYLTNLLLNRLRGKTKVSEMVQVIGLLWKEYGLNSEKIQERTGLPRDYIERLMVISEASEAVRGALDEEEIGVGHAYALSKLPTHDMQDDMLRQQRLYRFRVKDLEGLVRQTLDIRAEVPPFTPLTEPPPPPKIRCFYCDQEVDLAKIANPATCITCSGILVEAVRVARSQDAVAGGP